jgi:hypothetical protein
VYVGHEHPAALGIPGQSVRPRPDSIDRGHKQQVRVDGQEPSRSSRRREDESRRLSTENTARLRAVRDGGEIRSLCVDDLDRVGGRVSDKDATAGEMNIAVIEATLGMQR